MLGWSTPRSLRAVALLALATLGTACESRARVLPQEVMPMRQAERADTTGGQPPAGRPTSGLEGAVSVQLPDTRTDRSTTVGG